MVNRIVKPRTKPNQGKLWEAALKVKCGYCKAVAGKDCKTYNLKTADQPHAIRIRDGEAKKLKDTKKKPSPQVKRELASL